MPRYLFNDSHIHLTNYVQEGPDIRDYLKMMGSTVKRSVLFGLAAAANLVVCGDGRRPAHLLHAGGCAAVLLLFHRRAHRHAVQSR